jgi:hypothetical protein
MGILSSQTSSSKGGNIIYCGGTNYSCGGTGSSVKAGFDIMLIPLALSTTDYWDKRIPVVVQFRSGVQTLVWASYPN